MINWIVSDIKTGLLYSKEQACRDKKMVRKIRTSIKIKFIYYLILLHIESNYCVSPRQ